MASAEQSRNVTMSKEVPTNYFEREKKNVRASLKIEYVLEPWANLLKFIVRSLKMEADAKPKVVEAKKNRLKCVYIFHTKVILIF